MSQHHRAIVRRHLANVSRGFHQYLKEWPQQGRPAAWGLTADWCPEKGVRWFAFGRRTAMG